MHTRTPTTRRAAETSDHTATSEDAFDHDAVQLRSLAFAREDATRRHDPGESQAIADRGLGGPASELPHQAAIQSSFGEHDVSGIEAHVGGPATKASEALGAAAYATGDQVAFREQPSLRTAAHEAAHVVQHRAGVQLEGGMGAGDAAAEAHADAVADRVVAGESAVGLLDEAPAAAGVHREEADGARASEPPSLGLDPPVVTFAAGQTGQAYQQLVKITNYGDDNVDIENLTAGGPFTVYLYGAGMIAPGETSTVMVVYKPTAAGSHASMLSIIAGGGAAVSTLVSGTAIEPPAVEPPTPTGTQPGKQGDVPTDQPVFGPDLVPGADQAPPVATLAPVSWLSASPSELDFSTAKDDLGTTLTLTNDGMMPVTVQDLYVSGGDRAFHARLLGAETIEPGTSAQVAVEFTPQPTDGATAWLIVETDDGAQLHVPLSGPRGQDLVSGGYGKLDVFPENVDLGDVQVGQTSGKPVLLRNRGLESVKVTQLVGTGSGFDADALPSKEIAPGATMNVGVGFRATKPGEATSMMYVMGAASDEVYGSFMVRANGTERPTVANDKDGPAVDPAPAGDLETERQRGFANRALREFDQAAGKASQASYSMLHKEWIEYLTFTSLDPTISRGEMPDSSVMRAIMSNAIGNAISDFGVKPMDRIAPRVADVAERMIYKAAAHAEKEVSIKSAARAATLLGGGVGFVIGVLVETAAGKLFDWLFPDHAAEEAAHGIYREGQASGAKITGESIQAKVGELDEAQTKANAARDEQSNRFGGQIEQARTEEDLAQLTEELKAKTAEANAVQPQGGGISRGLLGLWVRDHAASTSSSSKELDGQWDLATEHLAKEDPDHFGKGKVMNQPDLFLAQCLHEWGAHGLAGPPELQAGIYDAIGASTDDVVDASKSAGIARKFFERFQGREFVWNQRSTKGRDEIYQQGLYDDDEERPAEGQEEVSCVPELAIEDNCCVVKRFDYRVVWGARDIHLQAFPGDPKWHHLSQRNTYVPSAAPAHVQNTRMFESLAHLRAEGYVVTQEADAADNAALLATFGESAAIPATMHADGRPEPVTVYRLVVGDGQKAPGITGDQKRVGNTTMYKAGNTIVLIDGVADRT